MATGTSAALPFPIPTQPWPSPTTTSAQKLNRLPPLTTFATRLMNTTLSLRLSSSGLTRTMRRSSHLKLQSVLARRLGQCFDAAVVEPASPIEHHGLDPHRFCTIGQELAYRLRSLDVGSGLEGLTQLLVESRGRRQRASARVINQLRIDMTLASIDIQT